MDASKIMSVVTVALVGAIVGDLIVPPHLAMTRQFLADVNQLYQDAFAGIRRGYQG
jgi:hypothetical protein